MFLHRSNPEPAAGEGWPYSEHFAGKLRRFEFRLQGNHAQAPESHWKIRKSMATPQKKTMNKSRRSVISKEQNLRKTHEPLRNLRNPKDTLESLMSTQGRFRKPLTLNCTETINQIAHSWKKYASAPWKLTQSRNCKEKTQKHVQKTRNKQVARVCPTSCTRTAV